MSNFEPNSVPTNDAYKRWRRGLAYVAAFSAIGLFYASIIPLQSSEQAFTTAWQQFLTTPWLDLGVYNRADWVANAIVVLPIGFAGTGAICFGKRATLNQAFAVSCLIMTTALLVASIELVQLWFPPRTVSLNDIAAGWVGALLGPLLWLVLGAPILERLLAVKVEDDFAAKKDSFCTWLLAVYLIGLCLWSLLPGDLIMSRHELTVKFEAGRIILLPGSEIVRSTSGRDLIGQLLTMLATMVKLVPLGLLTYLSQSQNSQRQCREAQGKRNFWLILCTPPLVELLQLPIFSRHFTITDVIMGWLGAWLGWPLAKHSNRLLAFNRFSRVRFALLLTNLALIVASFLWGAQRFATGAEMEARFHDFFSMPFVRYYYGTEFSAGFNLLMKILLFMALGFTFANFLAPYSGSSRHDRNLRFVGLFAIAAFGFMLEVLQIFLVPCVPDASDTFVYLFSAALGFLAWKRANDVLGSEAYPPIEKN